MANFTESNPPAFPLPLGSMNMSEPGQSGGMTLLDYFAAAALTGLLANQALAEVIEDHGGAKGGWIEESAYAFGEAMLKARA